MSAMKNATIMVRDFPGEIWRQARVASIERGLTMKGVLIEALRDWLAKQREKA